MSIRPLYIFAPAVLFYLQACSPSNDAGEPFGGDRGETGGDRAAASASGGQAGKAAVSDGTSGKSGGQAKNAGGSSVAKAGDDAPGARGGASGRAAGGARQQGGEGAGSTAVGGGSVGKGGGRAGSAGGGGGATNSGGASGGAGSGAKGGGAGSGAKGGGAGSGGTGGAGGLGRAGAAGAAPGGGQGPGGAPSTDSDGGAGAGVGAGTKTVRTGDCSPPSAYRNLFADLLGKTEEEIDKKLEDGYQSLFHGGSDATVYYEVGTDQAYILDVNNNDVRSEGMSYGMMISVQMDKKTEFNRLWAWTKKVMGQGNGLFGWQARPPSTLQSSGSAPDGEEYFATALIFASKRWGDSTLLTEAKKTLGAMLSGNLFNQSNKLINFVAGSGNTDPSYILPAFYEVWACVDTQNKAFWDGAITAGRSLLQKTCNSSTGLAPYKANYDGSPLSGEGYFQSDPWRVVGNIMMDYNFFAEDPWQTTFAKTYAAFWAKTQKLSPMPDELDLNGTVRVTHADAAKGLMAENALVAFGVPDADGKYFVQTLWDMKPPTGKYRYYDGMLYMLTTLHASGRFKLWY